MGFGEVAKLDESLFLQPRLTIGSLDFYWVKKSILEAIKKSLSKFEGTLLDIGCGQQPYRSLLVSPPSSVKIYIGLDLEGINYGGEGALVPDLRWDGKVIPLGDATIDTVFATEVFEHCPDPVQVFNEIYRVLRPGGQLFFTVPFLWPIHDAPFDYYRYTPFALECFLEQAGFKDILMEALGGWDASLGQMICLWITRRPISNRRAFFIRRLLSFSCFPIIKFLYKKDRRPESFVGNTMITGISCLAGK